MVEFYQSNKKMPARQQMPFRVIIAVRLLKQTLYGGCSSVG